MQSFFWKIFALCLFLQVQKTKSMKFLFWNIHKNANAIPYLHNIVREEGIDVVGIAEYPPEYAIENVLRSRSMTFSYLKPVVDKEKIKIFYRNSRVKINNKLNGQFVVIKQIKSLGYIVSLIFCHLPSKISCNEDEQLSRATAINREINDYEQTNAKNRLTIVCGDFNMNPFDKGMVHCEGFHAVMDKRIAMRRWRKFQETDYSFFYNPMWGCLGDNGKGGTPGTYFYDPSHSIQYFWNMFDQVLIRPDLIPLFDDKSLKIVTTGKSYNLMNINGRIDKKISDHLPIMFNLKI